MPIEVSNANACQAITFAYWSSFLQQIASHGLFDLNIEAEGDTWIDDHHTNEDLGMLLCTAGLQSQICRYTILIVIRSGAR